MFEINSFINKYVTHRKVSMFNSDIELYHSELLAGIKGKSFLVIGGAGSIGSSFVKAILPFFPSEIVIVDINENELAEFTRFLRSSAFYGPIVPTLFRTYAMDYGSIAFKHMFVNHTRSDGSIGFDIIANFSAHKHVRSEKDIYSIEALIRNNIINAKYLLDFLEENPPESYFCVSTDKAANPVNIMGASKRIMEDLIFSYSSSFSVKTARFANVAFSNGSLPASFLKRIGYHQPLSAPLDVKRYFVSPEESGQICMLAAILGNNRSILFPKLEKEQMTSFDKIAEDLLHEMGFNIKYCNSECEAIVTASIWEEHQPYPVYFSKSDTSGEKPYEEFYTDDESLDFSKFSSLGIIKDKPIPKREKLVELINKLDLLFKKNNCSKERVVEILEWYLPNFEHIETGKSLDEKM